MLPPTEPKSQSGFDLGLAEAVGHCERLQFFQRELGPCVEIGLNAGPPTDFNPDRTPFSFFNSVLGGYHEIVRSEKLVGELIGEVRPDGLELPWRKTGDEQPPKGFHFPQSGLHHHAIGSATVEHANLRMTSEWPGGRRRTFAKRPHSQESAGSLEAYSQMFDYARIIDRACDELILEPNDNVLASDRVEHQLHSRAPADVVADADCRNSRFVTNLVIRAKKHWIRTAGPILSPQIKKWTPEIAIAIARDDQNRYVDFRIVHENSGKTKGCRERTRSETASPTCAAISS